MLPGKVRASVLCELVLRVDETRHQRNEFKRGWIDEGYIDFRTPDTSKSSGVVVSPGISTLPLITLAFWARETRVSSIFNSIS